MRRLLYHIFINLALPFGRAQKWLADEFRQATHPIHLPYALLALLLWLPARGVFYCAFRLAFAFADGLTYEQRERFRP